MAFMDWQDTFEINIKEIDDHHKHLVSLLNLVYDNFNTGANRETLSVVLNELTDYTRYHFQAEEEWMIKNNYPGFSQHREGHIWFTNKIIDFNNDYKSGNMNMSVELMTFLMNWLTNHILTTDASFRTFAENTASLKMNVAPAVRK